MNADRQVDHAHPGGREPLFNAPAPIVAMAAVLLGLHGLREVAGLGVEPWALVPPEVWAGRPWGLVTHLGVHGGWIHVGMNALAVLAFGAPTARLFGSGLRGVLTFVAFFVACGALAGLGYAAFYPRDPTPLVGASGAASGLFGSAARLIQGRGTLRPALGRVTLGMTVSWIVANAALGLTGLTPGAAGVPVAWQAHIFGYFAGLLLIDFFAWLAGRRGLHGPITH